MQIYLSTNMHIFMHRQKAQIEHTRIEFFLETPCDHVIGGKGPQAYASLSATNLTTYLPYSTCATKLDLGSQQGQLISYFSHPTKSVGVNKEVRGREGLSEGGKGGCGLPSIFGR